MFKELIEILHFGIFSEIPILIEGISNMGKMRAINYLKEILNYKIIPIRLTKNTKVEELFIKRKIDKEKGKFNIDEIDTTFFDVLKDKQKAENSIILFENLNQASPSVLDKLGEIFDKTKTELLLPNGSKLKKTFPLKIICIIN